MGNIRFSVKFFFSEKSTFFCAGRGKTVLDYGMSEASPVECICPKISHLRDAYAIRDWAGLRRHLQSPHGKALGTLLAGELLADPVAFCEWMRETGAPPSMARLGDACGRGDYVVMEWLANHGFLKGQHGHAKLLLSSVGHLDVFRMLIAKGASIAVAESIAGMPLLGHALLCGSEDTALWLLRQYRERYADNLEYYAQQCLARGRFRVLGHLLIRLARGVLEKIMLRLIQLKDSVCPELSAAVARVLRGNNEWPMELRDALRIHFRLAFHEVMPAD